MGILLPLLFSLLLCGVLFFLLPLMFFLSSTLGRRFSLVIAHDSWLARSDNWLIRRLFDRFIV